MGNDVAKEQTTKDESTNVTNEETPQESENCPSSVSESTPAMTTDVSPQQEAEENEHRNLVQDSSAQAAEKEESDSKMIPVEQSPGPSPELAIDPPTAALPTPAPKDLLKDTVITNKQDTLEFVQGRISSLVSLHKQIDLSKVPDLYKNTYGKKLDCQKFKLGKLRLFLESIPDIEVRKIKDKNEKGKPYSCLGVTSKTAISNQNKESSMDIVTDDDENQATSDPFKSTSESSHPTQSFFEFASKTKAPTLMSQDAQTSNTDLIARDNIDILAFLKPEATTSMSAAQACLGDEETATHFEERAFLGCRRSVDNEIMDDPVYLNTHQPFCLATIGVQGAGKSHTLSCVLESCLLHNAPNDAIRLKNPMTALVLHYDQSTTSICEAAGLLTPSPDLPAGYGQPAVPRDKATILVSPTFYKQRKAFYGDYCTVRPLLFRWKSLTADHIKRIMGITSSDNQLYVASFMTLLRRYQRQAVIPTFTKFIQEVTKLCNIKTQSGPLGQRIALLESVIAESKVNNDIAAESTDIEQAMAAELDLIIVDLTDPLLAKNDANGLFQVVTEQFRSNRAKGGKLLALDEAHKFMEGNKNDGLSEAIINVARLMRHDGIRLVVSTQSPKALSPEVLELVSVAVLHHFHSQDWWTYIRQKLPLPDEDWYTILSLGRGNALVFASRSGPTHATPMVIRRRLTADFGASRVNNS